jgi:hypothetical protein
MLPNPFCPDLISHVNVIQFHVIFEDSGELEDEDAEAAGPGDVSIVEEEEDGDDEDAETTSQVDLGSAYEDGVVMAM